ncbi:UNVERIFIED_ORG: hypothetical protein J2W66_002671 [Agrobacterium larrymoorei]|nr:hypothetical protein [Agrobacterium larrymoorei]
MLKIWKYVKRLQVILAVIASLCSIVTFIFVFLPT